MKPVLVIHGGAGSKALSAQRKSEILKSLHGILHSCQRRLLKGASALEAVTLAARLLEDDELYNAGRGSKIQSDGHIRMSAALMDGSRRRFGGCVNVEGVRNPVLIAKALMRKKDRVLAGSGAARFAKELGLEFRSPFTPKTLKAFREQQSGKTGTIGAVAVDQQGRLAAATSTGGRGHEYPYRVSDSPTVAGNFACKVAAVSATGTGEEIVENAVAASICRLVEAGWSLERAAGYVLKKSKPAGGHFGLIAVDRNGKIFARSNTPLLIWGSVEGTHLRIFGRKV
jgi:L-asparaginase